MATTSEDSSPFGGEDGWNGSTGRLWVEHEDRHDRMLAHGSPPPRHLRTLLGLPPGGAPRGR